MTCKAITIIRGNDTDVFNNLLTINIDSQIDLTGFRAEFKLAGIVKTFSDQEFEDGKLVINFTNSETQNLPLGLIEGELKIFDPEGKIVTIISNIPFRIVGGQYANPNEISDFTLDVNITLNGETIMNLNFVAGESNVPIPETYLTSILMVGHIGNFISIPLNTLTRVGVGEFNPQKNDSIIDANGSEARIYTVDENTANVFIIRISSSNIQWGSITGELYDQIDLGIELSTKISTEDAITLFRPVHTTTTILTTDWIQSGEWYLVTKNYVVNQNTFVVVTMGWQDDGKLQSLLYVESSPGVITFRTKEIPTDTITPTIVLTQTRAL